MQGAGVLVYRRGKRKEGQRIGVGFPRPAFGGAPSALSLVLVLVVRGAGVG